MKKKKPVRLEKKEPNKALTLLGTYCNKYTILFLLVILVLLIAIAIAIGETSWYNRTII